MQLPHLHSLLESCQPQPAAVNQPQPADILQIQPAGIHQQQPTGVHQPQPAGVHQPQPPGVYQQQPTGVNQPQPAGIHQSMLVNNKNPIRVTDDGTLTSILYSRVKIAYICYELFVYYHTYRHFCGIKFCSTISKQFSMIMLSRITYSKFCVVFVHYWCHMASKHISSLSYNIIVTHQGFKHQRPGRLTCTQESM